MVPKAFWAVGSLGARAVAPRARQRPCCSSPTPSLSESERRGVDQQPTPGIWENEAVSGIP